MCQSEDIGYGSYIYMLFHLQSLLVFKGDHWNRWRKMSTLC